MSPCNALHLGDALAIGLALSTTFLSVYPHHIPAENPLRLDGLYALGFTLFIGWQLMLANAGAYSSHTLQGLRIPVKKILVSTLLLFGTIAIIDQTLLNVVPTQMFSRALPLGLILIFLARLIIRAQSAKHVQDGNHTQTHIVLCAGDSSDDTLEDLHRWQRTGVTVIGHISARDALESDTPLMYILKEVVDSGADTLLLSPFSGLSAEQSRSLGWILEGVGIGMSFLLPIKGVSAERMTLRAGIKPSIIDLAPARYNGWYFHVKRLVDIVAASCGIILLLPAWLIVAASIKLSDGGPVFFSQVRVGHNGRHFRMHKFRTMRTDAEEALQEMRERMGMSADSGNEILFKLKCDPRITRVGGFLRRYSIDELPQLFNVLAGSMTLIGPRPPLPREVANYEPEVLRKFLIKPGLTGLWQTMGRSNLSWKDSVHLDLYYAENCSPLIDVRILLRTVKAVLSKEGAY
ncbi:MAG: sugar transferase [Corynebacterium sp.]|uniref:sugar transferase n=1 Tax=Corynebacterium sp. TaxID=1720 RepID=UPI0026E06BC6|nr:sugar transferase [Corynebacterium sp.]MDO5670277.1 sugar transferase [Corynebacterium sp.]